MSLLLLFRPRGAAHLPAGITGRIAASHATRIAIGRNGLIAGSRGRHATDTPGRIARPTNGS